MSVLTLVLVQLAAAPAPAVVAVPAAGQPLLLVCQGAATAPLTGSAIGTGSHHRKHKAGDTAAGADSALPDTGGIEFVFEFGATIARARYPAAIVPTLHGGSSAGWWPVQRYAASDDAFTGSVAFNPINRSHFTIDRRTGALDVQGLQANASGHCARLDPTRHLF